CLRGERTLEQRRQRRAIQHAGCENGFSLWPLNYRCALLPERRNRQGRVDQAISQARRRRSEWWWWWRWWWRGNDARPYRLRFDCRCRLGPRGAYSARSDDCLRAQRQGIQATRFLQGR